MTTRLAPRPPLPQPFSPTTSTSGPAPRPPPVQPKSSTNIRAAIPPSTSQVEGRSASVSMPVAKPSDGRSLEERIESEVDRAVKEAVARAVEPLAREIAELKATLLQWTEARAPHPSHYSLLDDREIEVTTELPQGALQPESMMVARHPEVGPIGGVTSLALDRSPVHPEESPEDLLPPVLAITPLALVELSSKLEVPTDNAANRIRSSDPWAAVPAALPPTRETASSPAVRGSQELVDVEVPAEFDGRARRRRVSALATAAITLVMGSIAVATWASHFVR